MRLSAKEAMKPTHFSFDGKLIAIGPLVKTRFEIPEEEIHPVSPDKSLRVCTDYPSCTEDTSIQTTLEASSINQIVRSVVLARPKPTI